MKRFLLAPIVAFLFAPCGLATPQLGNTTSPDGRTKAQIDFPMALRAPNSHGTNFAGLCVFTSVMHSARWQKETALEDFQSLMKKEPGGGWPQRLDKMIAKYAPLVDYAQYEGRDPAVIKATLAGNRLPSVTYSGRDPHYRGPISHMVNVLHYDDHWVCILDNNYIGENDLVWMSPAEFLDRWRGKGSGWAVVLLKEPPESPVRSDIGQNVPSTVRGDVEPIQYVWHYYKSDPYRIYLMCDGQTVGGYDFKEHYFRFYAADENRWLAKREPPLPPPPVIPYQPSGIVGFAEDYGIPLYLFPPRSAAEERWTRKGQPVAKDDLLRLLAPRVRPQPDPFPAGPSGTSLAPAFVLGFTMLVLCLFRKEQ
jgi:hypothetical protein